MVSSQKKYTMRSKEIPSPSIGEIKTYIQCFINCHDFENFQKTIVKKVDSDDELYYTILNKQIFHTEKNNYTILKNELYMGEERPNFLDAFLIRR